MRALLRLACAAVACAACSSEVKDVPASTQVTVTVDAEQALRAQISGLRAALWVEQAGTWSSRSNVQIAQAALRWPLDLPVVASRAADANAKFEVILAAYDAGGNLLAQTRVVTMFLVGKRAQVNAPTLALCAGHEPGFVCDSDSCHGDACTVCVPSQMSGACVPAGWSPSGEVQNVIDAGVPTPDAASPGRDAGAGDAAPDASGTTRPAQDSAVLAGDAAASDAGAAANGDAAASDAGTSISSCPSDNTCKAPYNCVPTTLGYTCRGQFANWPMPDPTTGAKIAPSYSSNSVTVVDNVTKLEWQIGIPATYPGCTGMRMDGQLGDLCTRLEAETYCAGLVLGGHDDWRLPSLIELVSLLDTQRALGAEGINSGYFGDTDYWAFISDSTYANAPSQIWELNYYARQSGAYGALAEKVRCVRAGAEPPFATPAEHYAIDASADTVTDRATGLVWQRTASSAKVAQADVEAHCTGGFRVPTVNELLSLVDPTREMPAIDPAAFPNTPSDLFWGALRSAEQNGVDFSSGELSYDVDPAYVRCVR